MSFLGNLLASMLMKLLPWLVAKGLEWFKSKQQTDQTNDDIDKRLERLKAAYKDAFTEAPVTPEQREELKRAISDFIRGGTSGGV